MAESSFEYSIGYNTVPAINIETIVTDPPDILPVENAPTLLGSVRRQTLDLGVQRNGVTTIVWRWKFMTGADFANLLETLWGLYENAVGSVKLTILTPNEFSRAGQLIWASYNVQAERPVAGEHYDDRLHGWVRDLSVPLHIDSTAGAFTSGFSIGFEV